MNSQKQSLNPQPKRKRKKKRGVKKIRRPFNQTLLGFLLQHEAPVEYQLLMDVMEIMKIHTPPADLIEMIGYSSDAPVFKKAKYWKDLIEYRKTGLYPRRPKITTAKRELYYIRVRKNSYKQNNC